MRRNAVVLRISTIIAGMVLMAGVAAVLPAPATAEGEPGTGMIKKARDTASGAALSRDDGSDAASAVPADAPAAPAEAPAPPADVAAPAEGAVPADNTAPADNTSPAAFGPSDTEEPASPAVAAEKRTLEEKYPEGLVHTVVPGDTLWDLSAKYLDTPWRWPELWAHNRFLTNPHFIYPGIKVVIFPPPGKEYAMTPPAPGSEPAEQAAPPAPPPAPSMPPPAPPVARVRVLDITPSEFVRAGEFVRRRPESLGAIRGGDEARVSFSEGDRVFMRLGKDIPAGQLLGVYRVRGPIGVPGVLSGSGYVKYLVGIVQVTGREGRLASGTVRASFEDLRRSDIITEEIPSYAPVAIDPGGAGMESLVITGRDEKAELSSGDFIYLDRGSDAGVAVGNVFRIRKYLGGTGLDSGTPEVLIDVARAVVVKTLPRFSTAYVAQSSRSFGAGTLAARGEAATP